jgi:hypothetical protein
VCTSVIMIAHFGLITSTDHSTTLVPTLRFERPTYIFTLKFGTLLTFFVV